MSEQHQRWAVMSTMTGGWGVARPGCVYRGDAGLLACSEWESLHDTWEEAMQEADTQARTAPEHEQAATAALEWLHRQSDRLGTIATRHGLDPFDYGYLHAVDATAHMLGQLLLATRLAPGAPISQHPGVHDDADRHRARAKAHPERTGHPSAEVDRHPQVHTHEVPSAPPTPERGPHTRATKEHENGQ